MMAKPVVRKNPRAGIVRLMADRLPRPKGGPSAVGDRSVSMAIACAIRVCTECYCATAASNR
jgi:hypothetical protein